MSASRSDTPPVLRPITAADPESCSADLVGENLTRLRELFPEAFTESGVDFEVLKQLLGGAVDDREEKYGLNWHGKRQARQLALTPSTGTLLPKPDESVDWDTTQNLIIEGDNLEVLKLLQKSYAGKVKLIYIDPPYNTGKDFVYPDNYRDSMGNYLAITGQTDEEGRKVGSNTEASGRFHTDWLNMMYPRLKLAKALLRNDGVIFLSIDDHEFSRLRYLCDEIFGEENFLAAITWQKKYSPANDTVDFSASHDYIIAYVKTRTASEGRPSAVLNKEDRSAEMNEAYSNPDNDSRGPWKAGDYTCGKSADERPNLFYPLRHPQSGKEVWPKRSRVWAYSAEVHRSHERENRLWWGSGQGNQMPSYKRFLSEVTGVVAQTIWLWNDVGHTDEARKEFQGLFPDAPEAFQTPKPTRLIQRIIKLATSPRSGDIVLDFFAGSGTTAHSVMNQNALDAGNRRVISVQLPEPTGRSDFSTIASLTRERVRRAGRLTHEEAPLVSIDTQFRAFSLAPSSIRAWQTGHSSLSDVLTLQVDYLAHDRSHQDILFELLLKLGLELTVPIEERTIAEKSIHSVAGGVLFACLAEHIATDELEPIALGIAAWHRELAPAGETQVVVRDSGFADDVAKTNFVAILQQHGLANVRSL